MIPESTLSPKQPPQTQPKRSKTKRILKKSKQPETQVDIGALDNRLTRLEKKVDAMSRKQPSRACQIDKDDIDKQLDDQSTPKKRRQDDNDQDPSTGPEKETNKRKKKDSKSSKKDKDQAGSSKKGKSLSKSSKTDKSVHADVTVHDVEIKAGESLEDDVVDDENPTQADASAPKQDKSTWFKTTWFNEMVNVEKDPRTFEDVMGSVVDFTKFTKNCIKKDEITKSDLEGPVFKLLKGKHKNYIELEYNIEKCYLALADQLDWVNPEGDRIPHDLSKPLPLHGALGRLTLLIDFFFNKDLEYLTSGRKRNMLLH
ncbi:hypothetical protein Tco_0997771 [Tanacetum coccineum]